MTVKSGEETDGAERGRAARPAGLDAPGYRLGVALRARHELLRGSAERGTVTVNGGEETDGVERWKSSTPGRTRRAWLSAWSGVESQARVVEGQRRARGP